MDKQERIAQARIERIAEARAKRLARQSQLFEERDRPLIERLGTLRQELDSSTLADLVFQAVEEGYEQGKLSYHFPPPEGRDRARRQIIRLLDGKRHLAMRDDIYQAFEYALNELEEDQPLPPVSSDLRRMKEVIERDGLYQLNMSSSGHWKITTGPNHPLGKNKPVVDEGGPVTLAGTPSDVRWRKNVVARLRKVSLAGVPLLPYDPFNKPRLKNVDLSPIDFEQRRLQGVQERNERNAEETRALRAQVEPLVAKLGSWENTSFLNELSGVIYHYGVSRKLDPWFNTKGDPTPESIYSLLKRLNEGKTLSERSIQSMRVFWTDLEFSDDVVQRYVELLRESRGLPREASVPEVIEKLGPLPLPHFPAEPPPGARELLETFAANAELAVQEYPLALEVLYEMVAGRADADRERVLDIALRVMRLERGN
jgi:hypothetical protein